MAKQGKCPKCWIAFYYEKGRPLNKARCLECGSYLERTSHQFQGEWRNGVTNEVWSYQPQRLTEEDQDFIDGKSSMAKGSEKG